MSDKIGGNKEVADSGIRMLKRATLIQYTMGLLVLALVAAPLAPIIFQSVLDEPIYEKTRIFTVENFTNLFTNAKFYRALVNSVLLAFATTIIAMFMGVSTAVLLGRCNLHFKKALNEVVLWPMYVSHLVLAFGWFLMYGPSGYITLLVRGWIGTEFWNLYTIPGMAVVAGCAMSPMVHLFCYSSVKSADASLEDAARTMGAGPLTVIRKVTIPMLRPAIIYSSMLTFIGALEMLSVPLIFGSPAGLDFFTTFLYIEGLGKTNPDYGMIGAAAIFLLGLITVLIMIQRKLLTNAERFISVKGKASRQKVFDLGKLRWPVSIALSIYFILTLVVVIGGVLLRSVTSFLTPLMAPWDLFTLDHFHLIFEYEAYRRSITNSIFVASVGAAIAVMVISLITIVVHRSGFRFRKQMEFVALYPRAVPGIVAGIGFFWAMLLFPFMSVMYGTVWILILAFTMRRIPTAFGAISPMLLQIGKDLDQSSRTVGADWWTTTREIIFPIIKPALFAAYVLLFLGFLKEYASAAFLFAPGSEIIGTTMLSFWGNGDTGAVAALAAIQIGITVVFVTFAKRVLGVKIYG
ncbi:MAG: ABC transporter permease [Alphaproteobacteria bacterium]